ncbi:alpha/beta hydrolase-fold protein [Parerythrobacter aurantius]|uniref:alpha/beta hydrolase n=1 Tax=Parerythrobacter aurantius TaxID=3127706 RepID=UPI003255DDBF
MRWLAALLLVLLSACTTPQASQADAGRFVEIERMAAEGLPDQRVTIWLPPGYDTASRRYGVLYMHDGQNLFDPANAHYGKIWQADRVMRDLVAAGTIDPVIIVGIWSPGADRYRQYLPQKPAQALQGVLKDDLDGDLSRSGPILSDHYLDWIVTYLKPRIDRDYRTRTGRADTTMIGASMGGIMSCYAIVERPDIFGRAGCVSSHWPLVDPDLAKASKAEVDRVWRDYLMGKLGAPTGRRIWMDHGTATLDGYYPPFQQSISEMFRDAGWQEGRDFAAREYTGAEHDEVAWNARLPEMLVWLLSER